jgi:hypothetical protein
VLNSAILVTAYNRPDLLFGLLSRIPSGRRIYISIDGPKEGSSPYWTDLCALEARNFEQKYRGDVSIRICESNLGCKKAINSAIDWAFSSEDRLIVLEDDVMPSEVFFDFMDISLDRYKYIKKVGSVNGWVPFQINEASNRVFFSIYFQPWGWGTWKDRWDLNDQNLVTFSQQDFSQFNSFSIYSHPNPVLEYWEDSLIKCLNGYDTWDTQWQYSIWLNDLVILTPPEKLTGNVGYDWRATHTTVISGRGQTQLPRSAISFDYDITLDPVIHPSLTKLHGKQSFEYGSAFQKIAFRPVSKSIRKLMPNSMKRIIRRLITA